MVESKELATALEALETNALKGINEKSKSETKKSYWFNILKKFNQSGLTQKNFCELHGLKPKSLSQWKSRFEKAKRVPRKELKKEAIKAKGGVNFLSLALSEPIKLEEEAAIDKVVFYHRSGFTLELAEKSNKGLFKEGLSMLMELTKC